jgi:hypothetical protein
MALGHRPCSSSRRSPRASCPVAFASGRPAVRDRHSQGVRCTSNRSRVQLKRPQAPASTPPAEAGHRLPTMRRCSSDPPKAERRSLAPADPAPTTTKSNCRDVMSTSRFRIHPANASSTADTPLSTRRQSHRGGAGERHGAARVSGPIHGRIQAIQQRYGRHQRDATGSAARELQAFSAVGGGGR